jgi:DNA-binding GntR family transcriptional regulator
LTNSFSAPAYVRLREQIRLDVVSGVWKLGQHVTMAELSAHYRVSANPVREALQQLQGEGVVEMRQNRGALVRQVNANFVRNVYDVRSAIEGMLAAEAARRATSDDIARITHCVEAYEKAVATADIGQIVQANRVLHQTINRIADNPIALEILDGRSTLIDALRRTLGSHPDRLVQIMAEHRDILAAIAGGDAEYASTATRNHMRHARDHMIENINDAAAAASAQIGATT